MRQLNAHIAKLNEQIARWLIIHQMLGTRVSDTSTLRCDCLYQENDQDMIRIHQVKTRVFQKPISRELARLLQKSGEKSMSKYDRTIEENKKKSKEEIGLAKRAIYELLEEKERITVPKLMRITGLSRGFFYKNEVIRQEMDKAVEQQAGIIDPRREILNMAMERQIAMLQQQIIGLKKENEKLRKALNKKALNILKNL